MSHYLADQCALTVHADDLGTESKRFGIFRFGFLKVLKVVNLAFELDLDAVVRGVEEVEKTEPVSAPGLPEARSLLLHTIDEFLRPQAQLHGGIVDLAVEGLSIRVQANRDGPDLFMLLSEHAEIEREDRSLRCWGDVRLQGRDRDAIYVMKDLSLNLADKTVSTSADFRKVTGGGIEHIDAGRVQAVMNELLPEPLDEWL